MADCTFSLAIVSAAAETGQPELVLTLAHLAAAMIVFFFGVAFVMSGVDFADDAGLLMSWPLRPREILAAKFAAILAGEYLTIAVLLVPVYIVYALHTPVSWLFIPSALVVFLLTPVIPLALAALLVVVLMRFTGLSRKRDLLTIAGGLLGSRSRWAFSSSPVTIDRRGGSAPIRRRQRHGLSRLAARGYPPSPLVDACARWGGHAKGLAALGGYVVAGLVAFAGLLVAGEASF